MEQISATEFTPILAHPERYDHLLSNPDVCTKLVDLGVQLQINAYDICENKRNAVRSFTQRLLEEKLVSYIGSDCHGYRRPPALQAGVAWIYEHCPKDYADAVVHDNAIKIIKREVA